MRAVRWTGGGVLGLLGLGALVVGGAALLDRPSSRPIRLDRSAPEVVAFLDAERRWFASLGLAATEHVVEAGDAQLRIRVLEVGTGPTVVVLGGGAGEAGHVASLVAELEGFRFLLVNLPGGGGSDGIDLRAIDNRRLVRDLLDAVYDRFELASAPIVATSRGGHHAWWYALDRPQRVTASVQLGAPGFVEFTRVPAPLGQLGVPGINRLLASTLLVPRSPDRAVAGLRDVFGHPSATVRTLPEEFAQYWYAAQHLPTFGPTLRTGQELTVRLGGLRGWDPDVLITTDELSGIDHPVLLIWPSNDPFGDLAAGRRIAGVLPDARLIEAGIGHGPWLDDPDGIATHVGSFLRAQAPLSGSSHRSS